VALHIYTAKRQPATRYHVAFDADNDIWIRNKRRTLMRCFRCKKLHWAGNMFVQVYYDGVYQFCADGKGCAR
jgi:hypothetical protein